MTVAADVEIRLRADIARLRQDLNDGRRETRAAFAAMSASAEAFKDVLKGLAGGLSIGAFAAFIKQSIDAADALNDLSVRTRVAIEDLAGLAYGAKLSDTQLEGVGASITKLAQNIGKDGAKFRELGITATEPLEAFKQLSDIFKNIQDPQQRAAFGAEVLGKSWQEAAVLLDNGAAGIDALIGKGKELSGITEQVAADAGAFNDKIDELGFAAQGLGTRIAASLLPVLTVLADDFATNGKELDNAADKFAPLNEILRVLIITAGNVSFVIKTVATEIGVWAAQIGQFFSAVGQFANLDISGGLQTLKGAFGEGGIGDQAAADADKARAAFDVWEKKWVDLGTTAAAQVAPVKDAGDLIADNLIKAATAVKVATFLNAGEIDAARKKSADQAAAAAAKEQSAYAGLIASIKEKMAADQLEIDGGDALTDSQKARIKLDEELAAGKIVLTKEHIKEVRALLDNAQALEKNAAAAKQVRAAVAALADERDANYTALVAEAAANEDLVAVYGKTKMEIARMTLARDEDRLSQRAALDLSEDTVAQLEREIEARKRNIAAMGNLEVLDKQKKASDDAAAAQVAFWKSIDDTAHSTFVSILDGSKDTATRLKDTFKNIFFDWLYQMTIKKWLINISTTSSGVGDIATALSGGASSGGAASGVSLINAGKSIYDGFTSGFAGAGGALGGYVTTLGNLFGSSATSAFGAGMGLTSTQAANAAAAYNAAGMASTGSAISSGSAVGAGVGIFAGAAGGYLGGNLISGQYGSKNTVAAGTAIGAAIGSIVPVVGTALGALIGGLLGGVANRLFGMGEKKVQSTIIDGSLTATGATGNNISTWTQKGGWFRSDKKGTDSTALSSEQSAAFSSTYKAILDVSKVLGDTIGADTSALSTRVQKLSIDLTGLATDSDKLGAITKFFEGVADSIAVELVPNLTKFQKEGESLSVTMERIVSNYTSLDTMLAAVGTSFGAVGAGSIAAREAFIAVNGGLTALGSGLSYFQQNFLTEAEQLAPVQKQLTDALKSMGVAGLTTNDQFKTYLLGLDKTTEAGATMFAQLLALAPAFNEITKATEAAAKAAADEAKAKAQAEAEIAAAQVKAAQEVAAALAATNKGYQDQIDVILAARGGEAAVRALEIEGMDASTVALYDRLAALKAEEKATADAAQAAKDLATAQMQEVNALISAISAAYNDLKTVVDAQKTAAKTALDAALAAINDSITAVTTKIGNLKSLSDALAAPVTAVRSAQQNVASYGAARAQVVAAIAIAKASGVLPSADSLKDALSALGSNSTDRYGSMADYLRDQAAAGRDIKELGAITDGQLTVAEKTLLALQDQKTATQRAYDMQIARLDAILEEQRKAVAIATGTSASLNSLPAALAALAEAIAALKGAAATNPLAAETGNIGAIENLYSTLLGRNADAAGLQFYLDEIKKGTSWDAIKQGFLNSPEYLQNQNSGANTVAELRVMNARMANVEADIARTANSTSSSASSGARLAQQFDQVSAGGNALLTEPA